MNPIARLLIVAAPLLLVGACTNLAQDDRALLESVRQTSIDAKNAADRAAEAAKNANDAAARAAASSAQSADAAKAASASAAAAATDAKASAERTNRIFQRMQRKPTP